MARGRMLNRRIVKSRKVNKIDCYFSKLLYTWIMPFLDRDGRIEGDPDLLKADIFPLDKSVTPEMIEDSLKNLSDNDLIIWYEDYDCEKYIQMVGFRDNQARMEYNKEAESIIPIYNKELHKNSRLTLDQVSTNSRSSLTEEKRSLMEEKFKRNLSEDKEKTETAQPFDTWTGEKQNQPPKKSYKELERDRISEIKQHWKACENLPQSKALDTNMNYSHSLLDVFTVFPNEDIIQAINNLSTAYPKIDAKYRIKSFSNFMTVENIEKWYPEEVIESYSADEKKELTPEELEEVSKIWD